MSSSSRRIRRFLGLEDEAPIELIAEPKIDGLRANLRYENGQLVHRRHARRRRVGEDITINLHMIDDMPHKLKGSGRRTSSRCAARSTCRTTASSS